MAVVAPTWESVYERNSVGRIKRDRPPFGIREEPPALIAAGYERMPATRMIVAENPMLWLLGMGP